MAADPTHRVYQPILAILVSLSVSPAAHTDIITSLTGSVGLTPSLTGTLRVGTLRVGSDAGIGIDENCTVASEDSARRRP